MYKLPISTVESRITSKFGIGLTLSAFLLAGCTDESATELQPSVKKPTATEQNCTADKPEFWEAAPSNINAGRIAEKLGVSAEAIAMYGRFGGATCNKEVSMDRISSQNDSPVVTIDGQGERCLVLGTQIPPVAGGMTNKVLAVCANSGETQKA